MTLEREPTFYPREATVFAAACAIIFTIVGVIGNLVTVIALLRNSKLRAHATTAFVVSLCMSDLLFCGINLPLTAARFIHEAWLLGDTLCSLFPFFFYGNVAASLMSMVAITINRYILIAWHGVYERLYVRRNIFLMLLLAWGFSFAMMVPPLVGAWGQLGLEPRTFSCTILRKDGASPKKFLFLLGFLLPCVVIIVSYSFIYCKVRRSRRNLQTHSSSAQQRGQRPEDLRLTKMMLTIFSCFLLCFLPLMVVNVADDESKLPVVHVLASVLAWASSVINPFIYAVSNRQYRAAYRALLCGHAKPGARGGAGGAPASRAHSTATHSGSGKTLVTDMHFNVAADKVKSIKNGGIQHEKA